jgi:2'-5' RNA ligase
LPELKDLVLDFNARLDAFPLELQDFAAFPPRVIYVDVVPAAALNHCQQQLEALCAAQLGISSDRPYGFHPHMTIAFKDLRPQVFPEAWAYFAALSYTAHFTVREVQLLQFREGRWQLV